MTTPTRQPRPATPSPPTLEQLDRLRDPGPVRNIGPAAPSIGPPGLSGDQRNAYGAILAILKEEGLEALAPVVLGYIKEGYDSSTVSLLLQDTPQYKQRFRGNEQRAKNGLPPLSPAEYLSTERAYRQALQSAGLPSDFYDSADDYLGFIGGDISPAEVKRRADAAFKFVNNADPEYKNALADLYGVQPADLAAYFLDPQKGQAVIDKRVSAAEISAAARRQGLGTDVTTAERLADQGISEQQARQGYSEIADFLPAEQAIAQRFGTTYTQGEAESEVFTGLASAARKRRQLNNSEQALFSGRSGVNSDSLNQNTSGAY